MTLGVVFIEQASLWIAHESEPQRLYFAACLDRFPLNQPAVFFGEFLHRWLDDLGSYLGEVCGLLFGGLHRGAKVLNGVFRHASGLKACEQLQQLPRVGRAQGAGLPAPCRAVLSRASG